MPYILQDRRVGLREPVDKLVRETVDRLDLDSLVGQMALLYGHDVQLIAGELHRREKAGEDITGDINFCVCRFLVGFTKMHEEPRYSKVNLINSTLRKAQVLVASCNRCWFTQKTQDRAAAVLDDVKLELYRRYAGPYEDLKCAQNGDIMENHPL